MKPGEIFHISLGVRKMENSKYFKSTYLDVKPHCKEFITEFKESKKRNHHTFNCSGLHVRKKFLKQIISTTGYENTSAWQQNNQDNSTEQPKEWE
uniref:Uncharacterized protein n=1 Tax=Glossina palpalis gambiensis TaxID=67801 RepID=A0A1B0BFX6_9MUSC